MKRKVSISILAVVLVLTLCVGLLVACNDDKKPATTYTVTYSLGEYTDGTAPAAQQVTAGGKITLPTVTWAGHTFLGWLPQGATEGEPIAPGTEVEISADITYIAQWEAESTPPPAPTTYTATYDLGECTEGSAPLSQTATAGSSIKLAAAPTWAEHTFLGWRAEGTTTNLAAESDYTLNANVKFIAQWDLTPPELPAGNILIKYLDQNGKTAGYSTALPDSNIGYGSIPELTLPAGTLLQGWYVVTDGALTKTAMDENSIVKGEAGDTLTLQATLLTLGNETAFDQSFYGDWEMSDATGTYALSVSESGATYACDTPGLPMLGLPGEHIDYEVKVYAHGTGSYILAATADEETDYYIFTKGDNKLTRSSLNGLYTDDFTPLRAIELGPAVSISSDYYGIWHAEGSGLTSPAYTLTISEESISLKEETSSFLGTSTTTYTATAHAAEIGYYLNATSGSTSKIFRAALSNGSIKLYDADDDSLLATLSLYLPDNYQGMFSNGQPDESKQYISIEGGFLTIAIEVNGSIHYFSTTDDGAVLAAATKGYTLSSSYTETDADPTPVKLHFYLDDESEDTMHVCIMNGDADGADNAWTREQSEPGPGPDEHEDITLEIYGPDDKKIMDYTAVWVEWAMHYQARDLDINALMKNNSYELQDGEMWVAYYYDPETKDASDPFDKFEINGAPGSTVAIIIKNVPDPTDYADSFAADYNGRWSIIQEFYGQEATIILDIDSTEGTFKISFTIGYSWDYQGSIAEKLVINEDGGGYRLVCDPEDDYYDCIITLEDGKITLVSGELGYEPIILSPGEPQRPASPWANSQYVGVWEYDSAYEGTTDLGVSKITITETQIILTIASGDVTYGVEDVSFDNYYGFTFTYLEKDYCIGTQDYGKLNSIVFYADSDMRTFAAFKRGENAPASPIDSVIGKYQAEGGKIIYVVRLIGSDPFEIGAIGSILYNGEVIAVTFDGTTFQGYLSHQSEQDGDYFNDFFSATYNAEDQSITIGSDTYGYQGTISNGNLNDFAGWWSVPGTQGLEPAPIIFHITADGITYGPSSMSATYAFIGDNLIMTTGTTYYVLTTSEGNLVGTRVESGKAPASVTFTATEAPAATPLQAGLYVLDVGGSKSYVYYESGDKIIIAGGFYGTMELTLQDNGEGQWNGIVEDEPEEPAAIFEYRNGKIIVSGTHGLDGEYTRRDDFSETLKDYTGSAEITTGVIITKVSIDINAPLRVTITATINDSEQTFSMFLAGDDSPEDYDGESSATHLFGLSLEFEESPRYAYFGLATLADGRIAITDDMDGTPYGYLTEGEAEPEEPAGVTYVGDATFTTSAGILGSATIHIVKITLNDTAALPTSAQVVYHLDGQEDLVTVDITEFDDYTPNYKEQLADESIIWEADFEMKVNNITFTISIVLNATSLKFYDSYDLVTGGDSFKLEGAEEEPDSITFVGSVTTDDDGTSIVITKIVFDTIETKPSKATVTADIDGAGAQEYEASSVLDWNYGTNNWPGVKAAYKLTIDGHAVYFATLKDSAIVIDIYDFYDVKHGSLVKEGEVIPEEKGPIANGKYVTDTEGRSDYFIFSDDWNFDFYDNGVSNYYGTYSWSSIANAYKATDNGSDSFTITLNEDGSLTVTCSNYSSYNGTYKLEEEEPTPQEGETVVYTGSITLADDYYGTWTLTEISFDKNDIFNTLRFKVAERENDDDPEHGFLGTDVNVADALPDGGWLCKFRVNDGSQGGNKMAYFHVCIKYGDDENTLIVGNYGAGTGAELGTLTLQGGSSEPQPQPGSDVTQEKFANRYAYNGFIELTFKADGTVNYYNDNTRADEDGTYTFQANDDGTATIVVSGLATATDYNGTYTWDPAQGTLTRQSDGRVFE